MELLSEYEVNVIENFGIYNLGISWSSYFIFNFTNYSGQDLHCSKFPEKCVELCLIMKRVVNMIPHTYINNF